MPHIGRWAEVAAHFVKPGGFFYVTEVHPGLQVFEDEESEQPGHLELRYPYWSHVEPLQFKVEGSYADREAHVEASVEYGWNHSLGEIVTAVARAGLRVEFLHEFPFLEWPHPLLERDDDGTWRLPRNKDGTLPLFFSLKAWKPE